MKVKFCVTVLLFVTCMRSTVDTGEKNLSNEIVESHCSLSLEECSHEYYNPRCSYCILRENYILSQKDSFDVKTAIRAMKAWLGYRTHK